MSRRKQAKPRSFKNDDDDENLPEPNNIQRTNGTPNANISKESPDTMKQLESELRATPNVEMTDKLENEVEEDDDIDDDISCDSFYSEMYSSQTSSCLSPTQSEDISTPSSLPVDPESQQILDGENSVMTEKDQETHLDAKRRKLHREFDNVEPSDKVKLLADAKPGNEKGHHQWSAHQRNGQGSYHCQFCDKSFPRLGYLKKHEQSHAEHMPFKCEYCARLFKHKRSRDRHTKLHTGDRRYRCPHCEAAFSRSDHLKIHMKTHDNQKPFQCTVCNRGYNTAAALTSHMQNHKKQAAILSNTMGFSPRSTGSGSSISSLHKRKYSPHRENYLNIGPNTGVATPQMPNLMIGNDYLANFWRNGMSANILTCIYCNKTEFSTLEQLHSHILSAHGAAFKETQKPFRHPTSMDGSQLSCDYCPLKFPTIAAMFHHLRIVHMDRLSSPTAYIEHLNKLSMYGRLSPSQLFHQDSYFSDKQSQRDSISPVRSPSSNAAGQPMNSQMNSEPADQDSPTDLSQKSSKTFDEQRESKSVENKFLCSQCNAALPDFESFRNHLKTHLSQDHNTMMCHQCNVGFQNQLDYETHMFNHYLLQTTEYLCNGCNKRYTNSDELQKHLMESHVMLLYKCSLCSDIFDKEISLQIHIKSSHLNELKLYRCTACPETFKTEKEFRTHVKTKHSFSTNMIRCMFCRTVCSNELDMQFHLATHAQRYRCPLCPESFHVEFLLDRHMQTHHNLKDQRRHLKSPHLDAGGLHVNNNNSIGFNNNNLLDYPPYLMGKNLMYKMYNPMNLEAASNNNLGFLYGYYDGLSKLQNKETESLQRKHNSSINEVSELSSVDVKDLSSERGKSTFDSQSIDINGTETHSSKTRFSCGICERSDFSSDLEAQNHRKLVHNLKTGVSLRCAYCNGNFRSRNELENHMKVAHNTGGKHKCLICDEIFPSPAILAEHKLTHSKVGSTGKCFHCSENLLDIASFRAHMKTHGNSELPNQCIACRQTLNSEFEVFLHAKYHTKSTDNLENTCAFCLEPLAIDSDSKVCENCYRKHNLPHKIPQLFLEPKKESDHKCNMCKKRYDSGAKLQEHLIEHTFRGCDDRGYSCYVCSAVFTGAAGLQSHISEHGPNSKHYDCNVCELKFFFRAELENHAFDHNPDMSSAFESVTPPVYDANKDTKPIKVETLTHEDEEYIEVEKLGEKELDHETVPSDDAKSPAP